MFGRTRAVLACSVLASALYRHRPSSAQVKSEARRSDGRLLANPRDGLRVVDATDNGGIHRSVGRVRSVARSAGRSACLRRRQRRMHGCRLPGSSQGRRQGAWHHSQNVLQAWRIVPHGGKCELAHPRSSSRTRLSLRARRADKPVLLLATHRPQSSSRLRLSRARTSPCANGASSTRETVLSPCPVGLAPSMRCDRERV
jgi:hypothetical protein